MKNWEKIEKVLAAPFDFVDVSKAVGYVCSYVPEEIILAAGYTPVRLFGIENSLGTAHRHLQIYACSLVRGILEEGLSGRLEKMAAIVFPDACDSIRRLSDIWRINVKGPTHIDLVLPVKLNTRSAEDYTVSVLKKFQDQLAASLDVSISPEDLKKAIELTNEIRAALKELERLRAEGSIDIKARDYYSLLRAAMIMDRREFLETIREVLSEKPSSRVIDKKAKRVFVLGGTCKVGAIFDAIEQAGGWIVGDDLCSGARYFSSPCPTDMEPIEALARRILSRPVCPAKHGGLTARGDHVLRRLEETRAQGVVVVNYKFCDPHAFDYPDLRKKMEEKGYPTLLLEIEEPLPAEGQIRTRCEAFIEMIQGGEL